MKIEFVKDLLDILKQHYSEEKILSQTKNHKAYKNINDLELSMVTYISNKEIDLGLKERSVSTWIERFLNKIELLDYDLNKFSDFYNKTISLLSKNGFSIEYIHEIGSTSVKTPTESKALEEELREYYADGDEARNIASEIEKELEEKRGEKTKIILERNQDLLIKFVENGQTYIQALKKYFNAGEQTEITLNAELVDAVNNMKDCVKKLSLVIPDISTNRFEIMVPFKSLYTLQTDWRKAIKEDEKEAFFDSKIIKDSNLNFENISSLLGPTLEKVSKLIDASKLKSKTKQTTENYYISKKDDDFWYKGKHLNLGKDSSYYKVFCALYAELPEGGEIPYKDLINEVRSRIPNQRKRTNEEVKKFIQGNLTDRTNGFIRYAAIPETEDNGKPLISVSRGKSIIFNNKKG